MKNNKGFSLIGLIVVLAILGAAAYFIVPKIFGIKEDSLETRRYIVDELLIDANEQLKKTLESNGHDKVSDQKYATDLYNKLGSSYFNNDTQVFIDFGFGKKPLEIHKVKNAQFAGSFSIDGTSKISKISFSNNNFPDKKCTLDVTTKKYSGACSDKAVIDSTKD
ncbi:MAG: type II secretion system protein [Erysipelotrichaceae bacterium]